MGCSSNNNKFNIAVKIFNSSIEIAYKLIRFKLKLDYYETHWITNFGTGAAMALAINTLTTKIIIFYLKSFNLKINVSWQI